MAHLAISVLGPLQIAADGQAVTGFHYDKVRALLLYLVVEAHHPHSRDELAGLLWPDESQHAARASLRQALGHLRQALGAEIALQFLTITTTTLQFDPAGDYELDLVAFSTLLDACDAHVHRRAETCASCAQRRAAAVALYRGDFLQGFYLPDSAPFEEWALLKREALRECVLDALALLAVYYERHDAYEDARRTALRQLDLDPWREAAHRQLMRVLALSGQRTAGLAQYERCRRVLQDELGVEPERETRALYERIRDSDPDTLAGALDVTRQFPRNLPPQETPFLSRERELEELAHLLEDPACRLITLVGPGGIGKTRLALQAAQGQLGIFADGVCFVPLAPLNSADFLGSAIAAALDLAFHSQDLPQVQLLNYLRQKELLLVLDNFEHLLAGTSLVMQILQQAPGVTLLVTSRERLQLQGEWVVKLAGLPYPIGNPALPPEDYGAVQLFLQRARRVQHDFVLSPTDTPWIMRICRLVEGMPLAIELAAAWVRAMACVDIAKELAQSLDVLTTSLRDVPERHRSLLIVFEHSWQYLTADEQRVLRRLSVFRGGFERDAAEEVAGARLHILAGLIDKSLLRHQAIPESTGRYDLHELVRQYAYERLVEADEREQIQHRHLESFLRLAEVATPELTGPGQAAWLERLEVEHDNLRAVFTECAASDLHHGLRLAAMLQRFWHTRGYLAEGRSWLEAMLKRGQRMQLPADIRAHALCSAGVLAYQQGDLIRATALSEESLALARAHGERLAIAAALTNLGNIAREHNEYSRATAIYDECLALYRELGNRSDVAQMLKNLGLVAKDQGDYVQAAMYIEESLALYQDIGDRWGVAWAFYSLGAVAYWQGDFGRAAALTEECLARQRELGDKMGMAYALDTLGVIAQKQGDARGGMQLLEEGLALLRALDDRIGIAMLLSDIGVVAQAQGDVQRAMRFFRECVDLSQQLGDKRRLAFCLEGLALAAGGERMPLAARLFGAAEALRAAISAPLPPGEQADYRRGVDAVRAHLGDAAFAALWAEGHAMPLEQAIAEALAGA